MVLKISEIFCQWNFSEDINKNNDIKILKYYIDKNKEEKNILHFVNWEYRNFKQFYLINIDWLNYQFDISESKPSSTIDTNTTRFDDYKYPINFGFIEKEKESKIKGLFEKEKEIKEKNIATLFFVYAHNNNKIKNNIYIGLLDNKGNNVIYFYLFTKEKNIFKFLLKFDKDDIITSEINDKIIKIGIIGYLYKMGVDISRKGMQDLIDVNFETIGKFYKDNETIDNIINNKYSRHLEDNNVYYYNDIIQCLVNMAPFKNIFLNRKELVKTKIVQEYKKVTFIFYKLMQYMWYRENEEENNAFIIVIQSLFNNNDDIIKFNNDINEIIKSIKSFIESILLSMHYEYKLTYEYE